MDTKKLSLVNFCGIKDLNLSFSSQETIVIVGANGSGKSRILKNLVKLLSRDNTYKWVLVDNQTKLQDSLGWIKRASKKQQDVLSQIISLILNGSFDLGLASQEIVKKNEQNLTFDQLSNGEARMLAIAGSLAKGLASKDYPILTPFEEIGAALIDDIDLCLDPNSQRKIVPTLKKFFPNCQFIVTTHSPQVVSSIEKGTTYVLDGQAGDIVARQSSSVFGKDSNNILENIFDTPERLSEVKEDLLKLFRLIHDNDLEVAQKLFSTLTEKIGREDPDLSKAAIAIKRKSLNQH